MGGCGDASVYGPASTASGGGDAAQASGGSVSSAAVGVGGGTPSATSAGGSGGMSSSSVGQGSGGGPASDFSQPGPFSVAQSSSSLALSGCGFSNAMDYDLYTPTGGEGAPLVVLGHGFQRDKNKMVEMATHMASYGVRVVTPNYCHLTFADTDHEQNAADQVTLATALASGADVIHAGYSAGGTAALLAAASDSATVAVLGLDAVDNGGIAATASATLLVPGLGLVGEPSNCNSNNNDGTYLVGLAAEGTSLRVHDATHCSFEGPTDVLCTGLCGSSTGGQQQLIVQLATAFVAWQAGVDPSGADWVDGSGSQYQQLVASGQISAL